MCALTYIYVAGMRSGAWVVWKQLRTSSVNSSCSWTAREVVPSALFKRQLSGSQLSSRWDKNVLSFKRFCSTGAVHQFSHLHSRGDKGLAGKFIFACVYTVLLSLYQPAMRQDSGCTKRWDLKCAAPGEHTLIEMGTSRGTALQEPAGWDSPSCQIPPPTPTLLNPILSYRLRKSIWSKSQAQREMLKCCNTFWSHQRNRILINLANTPRRNAWQTLLLIKKQTERPHMSGAETLHCGAFHLCENVVIIFLRKNASTSPKIVSGMKEEMVF